MFASRSQDISLSVEFHAVYNNRLIMITLKILSLAYQYMYIQIEELYLLLLVNFAICNKANI